METGFDIFVSMYKATNVMKIQNKYTAVIKREGDWYIGWVEEIPGANAQEQTKSELIVSLQEAAGDILEIHPHSAMQLVKVS